MFANNASSFLQILGIYLFTSGFLLTRLVLEQKSQCSEPPITLDTSKALGSYDSGCWHPKTFDRAVIILVDALRYDFTVPHSPASPEAEPHHWHNALSVLHEVAVQQPQNAFLLPFIADPPTTTLQRLKALTTGTLPVFLDAGSNFAGTAIDEDNLIAQLRNAGKTVVQLGDDTWHSLFPGYFDANLTRPYDSFNVWDLHTVDNGVSEHLFPLLDGSNAGNWDVLIGHYLGVDHAGHRYGPDHRAMTAKLKQMDEIFRRVISAIDDRTLLVVMGDHGMDSEGNHGGESDDEVEAALWMYSKKRMFGRRDSSLIEPPLTAKNRPVAQIDLVPTLALLLGLPIPFNNLGSPIEEAFIGTSGNDLENLSRVNRLAAGQVDAYLEKYKHARNLSTDAFQLSRETWDQATRNWGAHKASKPAALWPKISAGFKTYLEETLKTCRDLWARFDYVSMVHGVEVLLYSLVVLLVYACCVDGDPTDLTPLLLGRGLIGGIVGAAIGFIAGYAVPSFPIVRATTYCTAVVSVTGIGSGFWTARQRLRSPVPQSVWSWLAIIVTLGLSGGFASNSYTIWEDQQLLVILTTFGVLMLLASIRAPSAIDQTFGCFHAAMFTIFTRLASFSRLCREEQMPHCKSTYYASTSSSTIAVWTLAIPFVQSFLLPQIVKSYYNITKSYHGAAVLWNGVAFRFSLLLITIFWLLEAADDNDWITVDKDTLKTAKTAIAQVVLVIAFVAGSALFAYSAPFLNIKSTPRAANGDAPEKPTDSSLGDVIIPSGDGTSQITVQGYANVHGTRFFFLLTAWALAIILLQKPLGGGIISILLYQIICLMEVIAANPSLRTSPLGPFVLALLGSYHFFKTGHTATLQSIQWDSAFVPLKTVRYPWSPLFVMLNSFGPQILCAIAVPLTQLWKVPPRQHTRGLMGDVARAMAQHFLFYSVVGLATTMWAGHLRRHLMLYRVFMPKFLMAQAASVVVWLIGTVVGIGGLRWSFMSVGEVFGWA